MSSSSTHSDPDFINHSACRVNLSSRLLVTHQVGKRGGGGKVDQRVNAGGGEEEVKGFAEAGVGRFDTAEGDQREVGGSGAGSFFCGWV